MLSQPLPLAANPSPVWDQRGKIRSIENQKIHADQELGQNMRRYSPELRTSDDMVGGTIGGIGGGLG